MTVRVRFLSGNDAGRAKDLPRHEAEAAIATGFARAEPEPAATTPEKPKAKAE